MGVPKLEPLALSTWFEVYGASALIFDGLPRTIARLDSTTAM